MSTLVRQQMQASTGALAAERERLERQIEELSRGLPDEAAAIVRRADELMSEHGAKLADLKARRDQIDSQFDVTARGQREAAARLYREQREASREALREDVEAQLADWQDFQAGERAQVERINRMLARNAHMATLTRELTPSGKAPMALSANDLVQRLSGRHASSMMAIRGHPFRFGGVQWPSGANGLYPADVDWRDDEEKRLAADIRPLIQGKE